MKKEDRPTCAHCGQQKFPEELNEARLCKWCNIKDLQRATRESVEDTNKAMGPLVVFYAP